MSRIDEELANAYRSALKQASEQEKAVIKTSQRQWLVEINQCQTAECLEILYLPRITQLRKGQGNQPFFARSAVPIPITSFEEASQLLEQQFQSLKTRLKKAADVMYSCPGYPGYIIVRAHSIDLAAFDGEKGIPTYCKRIWQAFNTQPHVIVPMPEQFAQSPADKQVLLDKVKSYANQNFNQFLALKGQLSPNEYTDVLGWTEPLVMSPNLASLPTVFKTEWDSQTQLRSVTGRSQQNLLPENTLSQLLYLTPFPIPGFVRPVVFIVNRDQCQNCPGISLGTIQVQPNGRLYEGYLLVSQWAYIDALNRYTAIQTKLPGDRESSRSYINMGFGVIDGEFILWALQEQIFNPQLAEETLAQSYPHDFRRYRLLFNPIYPTTSMLGLVNKCEVHFN